MDSVVLTKISATPLMVYQAEFNGIALAKIVIIPFLLFNCALVLSL